MHKETVKKRKANIVTYVQEPQRYGAQGKMEELWSLHDPELRNGLRIQDFKRQGGKSLDNRKSKCLIIMLSFHTDMSYR